MGVKLVFHPLTFAVGFWIDCLCEGHIHISFILTFFTFDIILGHIPEGEHE